MPRIFKAYHACRELKRIFEKAVPCDKDATENKAYQRKCLIALAKLTVKISV